MGEPILGKILATALVWALGTNKNPVRKISKMNGTGGEDGGSPNKMGARISPDLESTLKYMEWSVSIGSGKKRVKKVWQTKTSFDT